MNKSLLIVEDVNLELVSSIKEAREITKERKSILYILKPVHTFNHNKTAVDPKEILEGAEIAETQSVKAHGKKHGRSKNKKRK